MSSTAPAPIKFPLHLWYIHVHVSFASVENSVEERTATVFDKKKRQTAAMLIINFSINGTYLESSCFYFPQIPRKVIKFGFNEIFENMKLFLKRASSSDQIKSSMLSPCSFTFKSLRCSTMSPKIHQFPFVISQKS